MHLSYQSHACRALSPSLLFAEMMLFSAVGVAGTSHTCALVTCLPSPLSPPIHYLGGIVLLSYPSANVLGKATPLLFTYCLIDLSAKYRKQ